MADKLTEGWGATDGGLDGDITAFVDAINKAKVGDGAAAAAALAPGDFQKIETILKTFHMIRLIVEDLLKRIGSTNFSSKKEGFGLGFLVCALRCCLNDKVSERCVPISLIIDRC